MDSGLVLLPGLLCMPELWRRVSDTAGFDALVPALPPRDSIEAIAGKLLERLPRRFVLAGFSMGGYVALEMMRQTPERIAGLILVATTAHADSEQQREGRLKAIERARDDGMPDFAQKLAKFLAGPQARGDPDIVGQVVDMAVAVGVDAFALHQRAIASRRDSRDLLSGIACPVAAVAGAEDRVVPADRLRDDAAAIPGASFEAVPDAGHMLPLEAPQTVAAAISAVLRAASPDMPKRNLANA